MAVDAAFVVDESHRGGVGGLGGRRAVRRGMALLTQPRTRDLEQFLLVASVGVMAIRAVLDYRSVLVEERAALLGVTGEARLVYRSRMKQLLVWRAMRVVARAAFQLPVADRHV